MNCKSISQVIALFIASTLVLPNALAWSDMPVSDDSNHDDATATVPAATSAATDPNVATTTPAEGSSPAPSSAPTLTPDQLDDLVAPIALYPDTLLSQIMVAATYPLEVVQAQQWAQAHPELKGSALTAAAAQQQWDPSVQALVVFPDVLKRLSEDVTWVTNLGNAFLADQGAVMDAVQRMRTKAESNGKLNSTPQEKVNTVNQDGKQVIEIAPANPEVIYVPTYDPGWIWGPADYYPYPGWEYPPQPAFGFYYWGAGFAIGACFVGWHSWDDWGWHPGWSHHTVVVNNVFVDHYHFNHAMVVNRTVTVHGVTRTQAVWQHNPEHRMGVPYANRTVGARYMPARYGAPGHANGAYGGRSAFQSRPGGFATARPTATQVQAQIHAASARASASEPDRFGGRQINNVYNGHTAFGGGYNGTMAHTQSSRGYSSLNRGGGAMRHGGGFAHGGTGGAHVGGGGHGGAAAGGGGGHGGGGGGGGGHH